MKTRAVLTAGLMAISVITMHIYNAIYSPFTGAATASQFDDSTSSYVVAKLIREGRFEQGVWLVTLAILAIIWLPVVLKFFRAKRVGTAAALLAVSLAWSGCRPYKTLDVVEVKPNETAWAIPLDASSQGSQVKFNSIGFLNEKKIAAKRIMVDKIPRSTGRMWYDIEWLPATRVITVDRSLVTREWTDGKTGTSQERDEGVGVVTRDSVKLRVGLTITASIDEDDASTYLYYHGARKLSDVLDQNIRSFAVAELTKEYSTYSLNEAQIKGDEIYAKLFADAAKAFKAKGITIQYLGNAEGLTYGDPSVQQAINARYLAEQDALTAQQQQAAQKIRNATTVMNAQTEADAARKLFDVKDASSFKNDLNIRMISAQAQLTMAQKWNGTMPSNILPANSPMLMNLGGAH